VVNGAAARLLVGEVEVEVAEEAEYTVLAAAGLGRLRPNLTS
jgi:hypothetical protein